MNIEFRITRNPRLLGQYYALREHCYRTELGIVDFDGSEDFLDRQGHILLAVQNGRCIAGARISSQKSAGFYASQLGLNRNHCCMWERFVFSPGARSVILIRRFCAELIEVSRRLGFQHALILSSLRNARFYRQCHSALDVPFEILRHMPMCATGSFAGLEHYLSIARLGEAETLDLAA